MKISHIAAALLMTCIFGFNYSVIKLGLNTFDQVLVSGLRLFFSVIPAIFFLKMPKIAVLKYVAMYGCLFSIGLILVIFSIKAGLSAGVAGTILQFGAFMTAFIGIIFLKEKVVISNVIGLIISLSGLCLISNITDGSVTLKGLFLALAGAFFWALANLTIKKSETDAPLSFVVWSGVLPATVIFIGYYFATNINPFTFVYDRLNEVVIFSILYQAYVNTLLGYLIWITLLSEYDLKVSAPTYILVPAFSLFFSNLIHDEPIGATKIFASVLIIFGVFINTLKDEKFEFFGEKFKGMTTKIF